MINISFKLLSKGWLETELDDGEKSIKIYASHLSDGIKELIVAVFILLEGNNTSQCSWQEEPGQYRWTFKTSDSILKFNILWFEDTFSNQDSASGQEVYTCEESLLSFGRKIARSMQKLIDCYGDKEYRELWGYEFPMKEFERLKKSLKR